MSELTLVFKFPPQKKSQSDRNYYEWGGVVRSWPDDDALDLKFGNRSGNKKEGVIVTTTARPGQLLVYSGCTLSGRSFKMFGLAWRCADGTLIAQPLPRDVEARGVFEAGGFREPTNDADATLQRIAHTDTLTDPVEAFRELCAATSQFMENHLLVGAPVPSTDSAPDDLGALTVKLLLAHSVAWPAYAAVLAAAATKFANSRQVIDLPSSSLSVIPR